MTDFENFGFESESPDETAPDWMAVPDGTEFSTG